MEEKEKIEERKKGGRPPKAVKRETNLGFFVTTIEHNRIKAKVATSGLKMADYLRESATNAIVPRKPTPEEIQSLTDLRGAVNNLNQLAKLAHQEGMGLLQTKIVRVLNEINDILDRPKNDNKD